MIIVKSNCIALQQYRITTVHETRYISIIHPSAITGANVWILFVWLWVHIFYLIAIWHFNLVCTKFLIFLLIFINMVIFCNFDTLSFNPLTAKLFNWNFYSLEVVSRWRDPQLQVNENYSDLTKWRLTIFNPCWFMSHPIFNMFKCWYWMC